MTETKKNHRRQDILLYEQNLLEGDERRELEEHMRDCPECQATLVEVKRFLPRLHEALKPKELPAEELLRRVKAQMEKKDAKVAFFRRPRARWVGLAVGAAAAAAIAVEALLPSLEPAMVAKQEDAGARSGVVAAPRRPEGADAGDEADAGAGADAGEGKAPSP